MLLAAKEIDIVFTVDGREYLTKKHLVTEVKNECIGNGTCFEIDGFHFVEYYLLAIEDRSFQAVEFLCQNSLTR